jgi:hypothetical protein
MTDRKSQNAERSRRYRERMKARGLKQIRLWVYDASVPGFQEDLNRQIDLINASAEGQEALDFIEATADRTGWTWDEDGGSVAKPDREAIIARLDALRAKIGRLPGPSSLDLLRIDRARDDER